MSAPFTNERSDFGRLHLGGEATVFHCNFYNYWLQKTILLVPGLGMEEVITASSCASAEACVKALGGSLSVGEKVFAESGFGLMDLSALTPEGGEVVTTVSHYGQCLGVAAGAPFARPQSLFDAGFAAGAAAAAFGKPFVGEVVECMSMGAPKGRIRVRPAKDGDLQFSAYGIGPGSSAEAPPLEAALNQDQMDGAVVALNLVGNEEGLIPRFGVMLTRHFAHFYNRISFEFLRRMKDGGMAAAGEHLLIDAGYRCAFHTIGGIFLSDEWAGMLGPLVSNREDAVRLMAGLMSTLGCGRYRIMELDESHIRVRIYDDYESLGYLAMYGPARRPVNFLATGGIGGLMNLVYLGDILDRPTLDKAYFEKVIEHPEAFKVETTRSIAMGDEYTEIVAKR